MGRKEERMIKKIKGEKLGKPSSPGQLNLSPLIMGNEIVIPVHSDNIDTDGPIAPDEFAKITHNLSDQELNRIIYENAKFAIREGLMPDWPEDDFGTVLWFTWNFISDEMREAFPAIAREYLAHCTVSSFRDIPYPRMQEKTWDDAYYFRVLLMMLYDARNGSSYSKNFLLSLYKVYYKPEYNKLKRLSVLTYLDILELHDEDCYRKGLPSGHTVDGKKSFKEITIERRMHEPGWTNVYGQRLLTPVPEKKVREAPNAEVLNEAAAMIREISECPDEPPIQPTASRIIIMAQLMGIPIDATCNEQAVQMNQIADSMNKLNFLNSPEYRKLRGEMTERCKGILRVNYPEMFAPFQYQSNERYIALQVVESLLSDICKKYDVNFRMPYDSRQFSLPDLISDLTITLGKDFPVDQMTLDEILILSMVQYLGECLCELMAVRDGELDEILKISRRKAKGEWESEKKKEDKALTERVLRSVESLREEEKEEKQEDKTEEVSLDEEALREEVERLRNALSEKEAALAEAEQKVIRQRVLYEKERDKRADLEKQTDEAAVEHAELIALREFVYTNANGAKEEPSDLDEISREELIEKIREKKVTILGGTEKWIKRMKRILPSWNYIGADDNSLGAVGALERADYIYIYTSALQHAQYYRAMNIVRSRGKMLYYLGSSNVDECLKQFAAELNR